MSEAAVKPEITLTERKRAYEDLRSKVCACGAEKRPRQSFCRRHYFKLPDYMRAELYQESDYALHYKRALVHLELTGSAVPPGRDACGGESGGLRRPANVRRPSGTEEGKRRDAASTLGRERQDASPTERGLNGLLGTLE